MLVDGIGSNVMTILAMRYLGFIIDRLALITLKMANKWVVMPKGVINSVVIIIMRISIVDFHVILKEDGAYPMILSTKP
jgi:hypothetical protein